MERLLRRKPFGNISIQQTLDREFPLGGCHGSYISWWFDCCSDVVRDILVRLCIFNIYIYIYIYIYMYIHILYILCLFACIYLDTHIYIYVCMYICTYSTHIHMYVHICTYMCICAMNIYVHIVILIPKTSCCSSWLRVWALKLGCAGSTGVAATFQPVGLSQHVVFPCIS